MVAVYTSDPKGRKFLSAAAFLMTIVIIAALNILRKYVSDKFPQYIPDRMNLPEKVIVALMAVLAAFYVVFIVILLPMWYKTIRYTIKENEIIAASGLFSKTYRIMKLSSVQHTSRISMPFSHITCFNFITLNALGGRMVMMFLSVKDCREIMKTLDGFFSEKNRAEAGSYASPAVHTVPAKYSVSYSDGSGRDYVYEDNSAILSRKELDDVIGDYADYTQLSFADRSSDQLSFSDLENNGSGEDS